MTKTNLKNGKIRHGMMIVPGSPPSLANDSPLHPRAAAPKRLTVPAVTFSHRRVTTGELHPYLGGIALADEPNVLFKSYEKPVEVHPGMTDQQKAKHDPKSGVEHLRAAGHLSRKG